MTQAVAGIADCGRPPTRWLLVVGIVLAAVTEAIASTVLSLGRNDIIGDTSATPDELAWLDVGYTALKLLGFALAPWLLTRSPPRTCLLAATVTMGIFCGVAAVTTNLDALIVLRAVQGFSGAVLLVSGQAILFWDYPRSRQPILQAIFAVGSVVAPATIAPALQGWLLDGQSWTWIFFCVLPIALVAAGLMMLSDPAASAANDRRAFDGGGAVLLAVVLFSATYLLSQGSRWDWFDAGRILWLSLLTAVGLGLLVIQQRASGSRALLDLTVFRTHDFTFAFVVSFVAGAALFGSAFLIPAFAVSVLAFTPTEAGRLLLPSGVPFVGALLFAAFLMQRRRVPPIATVPLGILLIMAAMWMLSGSNAESGAQDMMPAILLRGLGLGFLFLSINLVAFGRLAPANLAFGIGLFNIGRQLGGLMGVAGLQTFIDHHVAANRVVIGAVINPGVSAVSERLASTTSFLVAKGMDADAASSAAKSLLGGAVGRQASVIAFDTAFNAVALLFVVAAPILVAIKIRLARPAKRSARSTSSAAS